MSVKPVDETDLSQEMAWLYETLAQKTMSSLARNNIPSEYARDRKEALEKVLRAIPADASIGIGDSATLYQIGFFEWLERQREKRQVFNPFLRHPNGEMMLANEERFKVMRSAMAADVFLTGSNAITVDGKIVNIDARGNRVAPMIFGPKKVILTIGANKIVRDLDEALRRIKSISCPANAKRHMLKHHRDFSKLPCVVTGMCQECQSPFKICRKITVIDGQGKEFLSPEEEGITVILVGEALGL